MKKVDLERSINHITPKKLKPNWFQKLYMFLQRKYIMHRIFKDFKQWKKLVYNTRKITRAERDKLLTHHTPIIEERQNEIFAINHGLTVSYQFKKYMKIINQKAKEISNKKVEGILSNEADMFLAKFGLKLNWGGYSYGKQKTVDDILREYYENVTDNEKFDKVGVI